jgi:beta-lactamase regulating signal transducer with metallopeptidase domain
MPITVTPPFIQPIVTPPSFVPPPPVEEEEIPPLMVAVETPVALIVPASLPTEQAATKLAAFPEIPKAEHRTLPSENRQSTFSQSNLSWFLLPFVGLAIWCLGTIYFLLRFARSWIAACKILDKTMPVENAEFTLLLKRFGITFPVELRQSEVGVVPFTQGIFRPVVVLPEAAECWTAQERRSILTHELAHVKRRDVFWQILAELCRSMYWFHPLVWLTFEIGEKVRNFLQV